MHHKTSGFTLIELLLAIAAFAVMMLGAINVINQGVKMRDIYFDQDRNLRQLQRALDKIHFDLSHIEVNRGVRNEYFDYSRALSVNNDSDQPTLSFTKNSWLLSSYAENLRSHLQRVSYELLPMQEDVCQKINLNDSLEGFCLVRTHHYYIDHYEDLEPKSVALLGDLATLNYKVLIDQEGNGEDIQWQEMPVDLFRYPKAQALALEMAISSYQFGDFKQLIPLAKTVFEVPNEF